MQTNHLIKGTLKPIILKLLKEDGRMYGYEITQKVKEITSGKIEITEGALYPTLHKLEADGIVSTEKEYIGKRVRKYYRLTESGKTQLTAQLNDVKDFIATLNLIFNNKPA